MAEKFKCSDCKETYPMKERGYFSYSCGSLCDTCWEKLRKVRDKNERESERLEEKEFENKVRKIVNKVLDERGKK